MSEQPPESAVLEVENMHSYYGRAHILADICLCVGAGETVVLLGRNGAGKSTTLKSIMGLVRPRSGTVRFRGREVSRQAPHLIAQAGLGYVPEDRRVFARLSVAENLEAGRQAPRARAPHWTPEALYRLFPNLGEARTRSAGQLSGGEQQMLTIARTLMGNPAAVLLDEPSEGLAPVIVQQMAETILQLKNEGLAVLLSEQNLRFATKVSDRAYVVESGRIRYQGSMDELNADEAVRRAYLTV